MEGHHNPTSYSLHKQDERDLLITNKGCAHIAEPFVKLIPLKFIKRDGVTIDIVQSICAVGDSPASSEESKKSITATKAECFSEAQNCSTARSLFNEIVQALTEDYLSSKLSDGLISQEYYSQSTCEDKYRNTTTCIKAKNDCIKNKELYKKDILAYPRIIENIQ